MGANFIGRHLFVQTYPMLDSSTVIFGVLVFRMQIAPELGSETAIWELIT
jgi:hypothetical protein